jgi:hypothetical protein
VHSKKANILQIQKYLNGELDARAMHKLEMEALNDPFLMDALEGYENMGTSQQLNLGDLTARLHQRTGENKGRVIPWTVWPIAASVLIALSLGGLYLNRASKPELQSNNIAENRNSTPPLAAAADTIKTADTVKKANINPAGTVQAPLIVVTKKSRRVKQSANALYQQEISANDNNTAGSITPPASSKMLAEPVAPAPAAKDKVVLKEEGNLSERIVAGYTAPIAKKDTTSSDAILLRANTTVAKSKAPLQFKLPGKVDGVTSSPVTVFGGKAAAESLYIAGTIISRDDGSPLIGAAIRIKGTNRSTVTDVNGKFALSSPGDKATLDVVYIGYEPRQVSATRGDSIKVALKPDSRALSEVVVTTSKRDDDNGDVSVTAAHPQLGWGSLKKYLQTNAVLPDNTTGTVTVTFTVFPSGIIDEFSVKKSLNETADQKAIELIKNGPSWVGSTNNKPEVVTVKVKFQKQK